MKITGTNRWQRDPTDQVMASAAPRKRTNPDATRQPPFLLQPLTPTPKHNLALACKRARLAAGLTQEALAERAGVSVRSVGAIEQGSLRRPHQSTLQLLVAALHLSAEETVLWLAYATPVPRQRKMRVTLRLADTSRTETTPASTTGMTHEPAEPAEIHPVRKPRQFLAPIPLTPLIGRDTELADTLALFGEAHQGHHRLVSLIGPPGVGKTRLAVAITQALGQASGEVFPDGVVFLALEALTDPALVAPAIAQAVGVVAQDQGSPQDLVVQRLSGQRFFLALDTFEHLAPAAPLIAHLVTHIPGLTVLVTSRAPLNVRGECLRPIAPLALPSRADTSSVNALSAVASVALFVQRVHATRPDFTLDATNADAVAAICHRLDGLPLAIELAAARCKALSPSALLTHLDTARLPLLTGGARDLPARQRTLHATLAWSYDLLPAETQTLFLRLAVFAGGWTFEAAKAVCDAGASPPAASTTVDLLERLTILVDHSLLCARPEERSGVMRFTMLETVRAFGWEQLEALGERVAIQRAYTNWCLELAGQAEVGMQDRQQVMWLERLDNEYDHLRAALSWTLRAHQDDEEDGTLSGARLCLAVRRYWIIRGYLPEGRHWLQLALTALNRERDRDPHRREAGEAEALRAKVLYGLGGIARLQGDLAGARGTLEHSLVLHERLADQQGIAYTLHELAEVEEQGGHIQNARVLFEQSLAIKRAIGDQRAVATSLTSLGLLALQEEDFGAATALCEECLTLSLTLGRQETAAWALATRAQIHVRHGELDHAVRLAKESLAMRRALGDRRGTMNALGILGETLHRQGDSASALRLYREALTLAEDVGVLAGSVECLIAIAIVYRDWGLLCEAVRLLAAARSRRRASGLRTHQSEERNEQGLADELRTRLDPARFAAAWTAGEACSQDEVLVLAHQPMRRISNEPVP